jgi:hypothetical protein
VSLRHLLAVTRKEILHIFRDRMTLFLVFLAPALLLFIMAYALSVEIQHVPVAVLDYDRSAVSRSFIQQITAGEDLELHSQVNSMHEINNLLMRGEIKAALVIGPSFGRDLQAMRGIPIQIIIDGTEPQSGGFAMEHISRRAEEFINQALSTQIEAIGGSSNSIRPIDLRVRTWYNPGLEPRVDLIPGLLSIVLGFPALSVALTISHEREHGTLEQLMATPISRPELLLGKMIPYIIVGMVNAILLPLLHADLHIYFRHAQHGHHHRCVYAHPTGCAGVVLPADIFPWILPDRYFFSRRCHARNRAYGIFSAARHPLRHHHARHFLDRGRAGCAVALRCYAVHSGLGLRGNSGFILQKEAGIREVYVETYRSR